MDAIVYLLGGIGVLSLCLAAFVFAVAARAYVSESHLGERPSASVRESRYYVQRTDWDRRRRTRRAFPFCAGGVRVMKERRSGGDRRARSRE